MDTRDIEGCHRLPLSKNSRGHDRRVIVKFFNRKYAEAMLKDKKRISGKNLGQLNVTNKVFFSVSLCPYYRLIWGKFKDLPRRGKVHHVFCLGGIFILYINYCIMETQLNSIILVTYLTSFWTRILKINFCKYSICSVYIVKSLSLFRCEVIFKIFPRKIMVTSMPPTPLLFIRGHRGQNSGGNRLVAGLESPIAVRISRCN